jgi:hypothetical protein
VTPDRAPRSAADRIGGVTYDTGALIAVDRGNRSMATRHEAFLRAGVVPTVPTVVLAQAYRTRSQVLLTRVVRGCAIETFTMERARAVGLLAARTKRHDIVDLAVVEGAIRRGDAVVTSDPGDPVAAGLPRARLDLV